MQHWKTAATPAWISTRTVAVALLLAACLAAAPQALAQGELELPGMGASSLSAGGSNAGSTSSGQAVRTVTPDVVYSSDSYYPAPNGGTYASQGSAYSELLGAHLRARYNTRSYGQTSGNLDLGTMKLYDQGDSAWFLDGQVVLNDDNQFGYNVGVGYRFFTMPLLPGTSDNEKIAGISVWSDGQFTINDNFISQIGVSLEYLGDNWDVRSNIYVPFSDREIGEFVETGDVAFSGTFLVQEAIAGVDEPLTVTEIEGARRIGDLEAWGFVGGYGLYGDETDTGGFKIGVRGFATPDISLQFAITEDDEFGTNAVFSGTWFIGRTRTTTPCRTPLAMRMREPVLRNDYVAIRQSTVSGGGALTGDIDGDGDTEAIRVVHVDSTAADGGDGSFESPLNELSDINGNSPTDAVVLVHGGSSFTDDAAVLRDGQRLLGEGGGIDNTVPTTEFGTISLPETAPGAQAGPIPTIAALAGSSAVSLANDTVEVSNFDISGGANGIASPSGNTGAMLANLSISDTTGDGIMLTAGVLETTPGDASTLTSTFTPTISNVTFSNVGGDDINIDATASAAAVSSTITESITIADVTSTGGTGIGINLANNTNDATITDYSHDGGGTAAGGILVTGTGTSDGAVAVTDATISNQGGFGIRLDNVDAGHTFANVDIIDTGDTAFDVIGGPSDTMTTSTYTGTITQSGAGKAVAISGGHAGTFTFADSGDGAGVVNATNGDGIEFNDADGSYAFNSAVVLNGTANVADTGLDILNDSDGDITFADATIVSPTGEAVLVEDGAAALDFTGQITQANNASTVSVQGGVAGHTGALAFTEGTAGGGVINATNGDGLQFDGANGAYDFNSGVVLDGTANVADTGIDITASNGAFVFDDATITSPTGTAINIDGGDSTMMFTYVGSVTQSNAAAALSVTGGNEGIVTFLPATGGGPSITATNGPGLIFDNADGSYSIAGTLTLDGTANVADTGIDIINGSDGTFTFADATITSPTGIGLNVVGGEADVNYAGIITQANNAAAVSVTGGHTGTMTFDEAAAGAGVINATNGVGLVFNDADGTYSFNDSVMLDGTANVADTGIDIINGSDGTFTFADATITSPTGIGLNVVGGEADVNYTGIITQANGAAAVSVTGGHTGTMTFDEATAGAGVVNATNGVGLVFNDADGTYNFNDGVMLDGTVNVADTGIDIVNGSSGTFTFDSDSSITDPTGEAFVVDASSATVTYSGTITDATGNAVRLSNNTGGSVTFGGAITSTADGIDVVDNTSGSYTFNGAIDLDTSAANAVTVTGNSATIAFNAGDVDTTTGDGFFIDSNTGGSVTISGVTIDTTSGNAIEADNSTGTDLNFLSVTATSTTGDAVTLDTNSGGTTSLVGTTIDATTGNGLTVADTAGLTGAGNSVTTTTGIGVSITDSSVAAAGLAFDSVTVDGATNGIILNNVTGGTISVGSGGASVGDGGTIENTTGDAISITNVANVSISFMQIGTDNAGGGAGVQVDSTNSTASNVTLTSNAIDDTDDDGVLINSSGDGGFTVVLTDNTVSNTGGQGIELNLNGTTNPTNVTISDNTATTGLGAEALLVNAGAGTTNLLLNDGNNFSVGNAAVSAVDINSSGGAELNATVLDNTFANTAAGGQPFEMENNGGTVRLAITGNTASPGTAGDDGFFLINNAGTFNVEDLNTPTLTPDDQNTVTGGGGFDFAPNAAAFTPSAAGSTPTP